MTAPETTAVERTIAEALGDLSGYQEALTQALHERWHVGCHRECGGRLDDFLAAGRMLAADGVISRIVADVTRQRVAAIRNLPPKQMAELVGGEVEQGIRYSNSRLAKRVTTPWVEVRDDV